MRLRCAGCQRPGADLRVVARRQLDTFREEERTFGPAAEDVAAEAPVAVYDPVARDQVGDRVVPERGPDVLRGARLAKLTREPAVGADLAGRDLERQTKHLLVEGREIAQIEPQD